MAIRISVRRSDAAAAARPLTERLYEGGSFYIGGDREAHLYLNGAGVAPRQAVLFEDDGRTMLLSAAEGNVLNGRALPPLAERPLSDGDQLHFADYLLSFSADGAHTPESAAGGALAASSRPPQISLRQDLASMDTEDYRFKYYFLVSGGARDGERILLDTTKSFYLGWDAGGQAIVVDPPSTGRRAVVEFTLTSDVAIKAAHPGAVAVNNKLVDEPFHLSDGDEIRLGPSPLTAPENMAALVFHEPVAADLFALRRAENEKLRAAAEAAAGEEEARAAAEAASAQLVPAGAPDARPGPDKVYFVYFTKAHLWLFAGVAAATAAATYLLLEFL
jgi:hypothetical protein